jgi:hypothetical protein
MKDYEAFLASKQLIHPSTGLDIDPALFHPLLKPHQRYAWQLKVLHVFPEPIPMPGRQGLFEWDSFTYADQMAIRQASEAGAPTVTQVVNFHHIRAQWDRQNQRFFDPDIVYCGRGNKSYDLPESMWHNPFKGSNAIERFRAYVTGNQYLMSHLAELRGKKLCCWCAPAPCHCDVLLELLGEKPTSEEPKQLSMF